jgi:hypothetical protein
MTGDHHVIRSDGPTYSIEFGPNLSKMICGRIIKRQNFEPGSQSFNICQVSLYLLGMFRPKNQFA